MKTRIIVWCAAALASLVLGCSNSRSSSPEVPSQGGEPYQVAIKAPAKAQVGQEVTTEVVVTSGGGFKINQEYPAKLVFSQVPEGTKLASSPVTKGEMTVEKARLVVPVRFTPQGPGEKRFEGELWFSVCNPESCQMPREKITWSTTVEAGAQ